MSRDRYMPQWFGAVHPRYRTPYRSILFLIPIAVSFAFTGLLDQVITFSILSGLLGYTFMSFNVVRFRRMWPLGTINRGYVHPFHPIPCILLGLLCAATYFATYLGYGASLLSIMAFYILISIWFVVRRYQFVRRGDQFTMPWPRPKGY
jgi:ethanolamine permease